MTLLRRISQLVQDLRTLNVLAEEDHVRFTQFENSIKLQIILSMAIHNYLDADILCIKNAIRAEFSSKNIEYDESKIFENEFTLIVRCW